MLFFGLCVIYVGTQVGVALPQLEEEEEAKVVADGNSTMEAGEMISGAAAKRDVVVAANEEAKTVERGEDDAGAGGAEEGGKDEDEFVEVVPDVVTALRQFIIQQRAREEVNVSKHANVRVSRHGSIHIEGGGASFASTRAVASESTTSSRGNYYPAQPYATGGEYGDTVSAVAYASVQRVVRETRPQSWRALADAAEKEHISLEHFSAALLAGANPIQVRKVKYFSSQSLLLVFSKVLLLFICRSFVQVTGR